MVIFAISACVWDDKTPSIVEYKSFIKNGDDVPSFSIAATDGSPFYSDSIDKITIIYLFWSKCPDCANTTKEIMELWNESLIDDESVDMISIARGDGKTPQNEIEMYWNNMFNTKPNTQIPRLLFDEHKEIFNLFADAGVPRFYLTNNKKEVMWQLQSPMVTKEEILAQINTIKNQL